VSFIMDTKKRVNILISGKVQGVFFRDSTRKIAISLGITGYAKNLSDGRVEVVAEGGENELKKLVSWVKKGPPLCRVDNVTLKKEKYKGDFDDFNVI